MINLVDHESSTPAHTKPESPTPGVQAFTHPPPGIVQSSPFGHGTIIAPPTIIVVTEPAIILVGRPLLGDFVDLTLDRVLRSMPW